MNWRLHIHHDRSVIHRGFSVIIAAFLWTLLPGGTAKGLGIGYRLDPYRNDNMSAQEYTAAQGAIMDNGLWRPAPTSVWFSGDGALHVTSARDYTVYFSRVRDFYVPAVTGVVVSTDQYYTNLYQIYSNSLSVTVAGLAGGGVGRWQLSPPAGPEYTNSTAYTTYGTGFTNNNVIISNIPDGNYTLTFFPSNGYTESSAITTNISAALANFVTGTYARIYGGINISHSPSSITNATWALTNYPSGYTGPLTGLMPTNLNESTVGSPVPVGTYSVVFGAVAGYSTPVPQTHTFYSGTNDFTVTYSAGPSLTVTILTPNTRDPESGNYLAGAGYGSYDVVEGLTNGSFVNGAWHFTSGTRITLSAYPTNAVIGGDTYQSFFYEWNRLIAGVVQETYTTTNISFTITSDTTYTLLFSREKYYYDNVGDVDGDGLPDEWENIFGLDPKDNGLINVDNGGQGNQDNDFIPAVSTNPPTLISVNSSDGIVTMSGPGGTTPGYPLLRDRLLRRQDWEIPAGGSELGYAKGYAFNNLYECRGIDGYYLNNVPPLAVGYNTPYGDDPLTSPLKFDTSDATDTGGISDGWKYYFWYWRSSDAFSAGISNSANLNWVTWTRLPGRPFYIDEGNDTDGDGLTDSEEYLDITGTAGTDPTHCDTDSDGMDDRWEIENIIPSDTTNALDYVNNSFNPDGDFMASTNQGMLTVGLVGTALGTNVYWVGGAATNPSAAWNNNYTFPATATSNFLIYRDTVIKASSALTNHANGTAYAFTNYYGTNAGLTSYKNGYPVWVDVDRSGTYSAGDYALVNPTIKHEAVYVMAPAIPEPGVCSFDPRTAWTNVIAVESNAAAPNTIAYTIYQEYLGGDYIGRLSWDAGGQSIAINDDPFALNRNSYSNPSNQDSDGDGIPDGWELYVGLNDNNASDAGLNPDRDGLNNDAEWANATHGLSSCTATWPRKSWPTDPGFITAPSPNDPHPQDTDWDGLQDGAERGNLSNPTSVDTDGDRLPDGWELYAGTSITNADANVDADFDGLLNWQEYWTGTVPEWMDCDPSWPGRDGNSIKFLARRLMDWNPPAVAPTNSRYTTFGDAALVEARWFIPPDFMTCPSFLYANGAITDLNYLRSTNGFPAAGSLGYLNYHTTVASAGNANSFTPTDSDGDGMDDFWEVFHCLNPTRGYRDLVYGTWNMDNYGANLIVGSDDADPNQAGYQVGLQGAPFINIMALVDYYRAIRALPIADEDGRAARVVALVGPHNFGLVGMDPDNDGLPNFEEYSYYRVSHLHTSPSPLWRTDPYVAGVYSFVARNYTRDNTRLAGGFNTLGFGGITYSATRGTLPFRWAAMTEGFDTDNDLISDYEETTGYRTNGVTAGTDPLNNESPLHNRVLWLDGTNSWGRSYAWSHYGDFSKFSVEAWVRPSRLSSAADQVVAEKTSLYTFQRPDGTFDSSALANFQLGISSNNGMPYILFHNVSGYATHRAISSRVGILEVDKWAHLAGVFDGANLTLYVNGEVSATHPTTDVPARGIEGNYSVWHPNCNLSVGARETGPGWMFPVAGEKFFAGCIDEVRVWDRVLSAGEIKARKDRRLTPSEVGTVLGGNGPYAESVDNLFAYYRFTDLPDPKLEGILPSGFPADRPLPSVNFSRVYTNYLVIAADRVKRIPRLAPLDTRVIDDTPVATNSTPDGYGISTTNYLGIILPADFRNSANPYNFTHASYNIDMGRGMWLCGNAQGLKGTNTWLPTLDPNDPDSTDTDGDGLPDWWEQLYGLNIYDAAGDNGAWGDPDNDGLNNRAEYLAGTNPLNSDTDGNGIGDYDSRSSSNPYSRTWGEMFMDGDGMPDVWEMQYGLDPYHYDANLDLDKDGWSNYAEYQAGTNPNDPFSYPQPTVWGSADYFGNMSGGLFKFYVYNTNTMDGVPKITKVGAGQQVAETLGAADGTVHFIGRIPLFPLDPATIVRISAPAGSNATIVTFTFTGPDVYTYTGAGVDYGAGLNYTTGRITIRWASTEVPLVGANISVEYTYVNRNAAAFNLTGFSEGDFYLLALLDVNNNDSLDAGEPMGIMEDQPVTLGYTTLNNVKVHVKDSAPGYGRFAWTGNTTGTSDYPVVINKITEQSAPTVLTRNMRWSRNYFHEWDYQIAGCYGLATGEYQWWMGSQNGTFSVSWPASVTTPSLVYPRGHIFNYAQNQFKWAMDSSSTKYHLQIAKQASDGGLAFVHDAYYRAPFYDRDGVSQADMPVYAGELGDGIYYWRVASWNPAGESAWSEPQTFEINLNATNSHWIAGDIYYFGKADSANIIVEAFDNRGFSGKPEARILLTGASRTNDFKGSFQLRGLPEGTYYVRAYLDVTPAGGIRDGKLNKPWESFGFIRDPNNDYQPRTVQLIGTMFVDGTKLVIRDQDTDNDLLPDAWEMYYFGDLNQTGDMDYDGDGETNLEEYIRDGVNLNPAAWDTDGDGLSDNFELNYTAPSFGFSAKSGGLNPTLWDTDGDGYSDGAEMKRYHTDPLNPNSRPNYQPMCFDSARSPGDYDGDGRTDLGVYDITSGNWYLMTAAGQFGSLPFGSSATQPMLGDYDGDGCEDFAVFEPATGAWKLYNAWTGQSFSLNFGDSEMMPVPADYDGDNKTDLAVYYPAEGMWYIYSVWSGQFYSLQFGGPTMTPVPGDYNNDGAGDLATYESNTGNWNILTFDHYRLEGKSFSGNFGGPTMMPVGGDYDGDGRNDAVLFEPTTGNWYILTWRGQFLTGQFGWYGCIPAPGDYDGDGRTDICVYYPPTGTWYIYCWSGQSYQVQFGFPAAMPALKGR